MTWICIELYSHNTKPIIWIWSKLNSCFFKHINIRFNGKHTIIDVFATFFLLSYAKLVFTCFRIVSYGVTLNVNNFTLEKTLHVELDQNVIFFSTEHLPFVVTSAFVFLVVILPLTLLLALYPIKAFRSLLFKCQLSSHMMASLNIFVERFYSCYRDGLDGGKDMRSLASMYFLLRLMNYILFCFMQANTPSGTPYTFVAALYIGCVILVAIIRPYKKACMNIIDTLILVNLALMSLLLDKYSGQNNYTFITTFCLVAGSILASLPMLGITGFIIYKIFEKQIK